MMSGSWQFSAEMCCPLLHTGVGLTRGLVIVSDTFRDAFSGSLVLVHLSRSFRIDEENYYDLRLSTKPLARNTIDQPVTRPINSINAVHLSLRYARSLAPLVGTLPDWEIVLYFFRVDKQQSEPTYYQYDTYSGAKVLMGPRPPPSPHRFRGIP
jgi:hypothetical protein